MTSPEVKRSRLWGQDENLGLFNFKLVLWDNGYGLYGSKLLCCYLTYIDSFDNKTFSPAIVMFELTQNCVLSAKFEKMALSSFWEMVNTRSSVSGENETRNALMVSPDNVMKVFNRFLQQCTSPTSKLWLMYLEMMDIVRRYIYAERSGDWALHLATVEEMLPYLVSAGHTKYTACVPQYIIAMNSLPASVTLEFQKGNFAVRRKEGKFNGVWTNMALEQTFNKDAKTKLFSSITKNTAAVAKYLKPSRLSQQYLKKLSK